MRDEQKITLEEAHYRLSALPAHAAGFRDRGMLREGAPADVVVYDLKGLAIEPDWVGEIAHDFPGGEWRRVQRAKGYRSIIVNGEVTFAEGRGTGATPGNCCAPAAVDGPATVRPRQQSSGSRASARLPLLHFQYAQARRG